MFQKIFNRLGTDYEGIKSALEGGSLIDAYELCKVRDEVEADILKGMILILLKKYTKAIEVLKEIKLEDISLIPLDIYYELLGLCYYEEKNHLEAAKAFIEALKLDGSNFYAKYNLANIYILKKDYKKAYDFLVELQKIEGDNEDIIKNIKLLEKYL